MNIHPQETIRETRLLAVHVRPQRFGFAVFKGPQQLLDWGGSTHYARDGSAEIIRKRIVPLLRIYAPSALVVRKMRNKEAEQNSLRAVISAVKEQAERHSIELVFVGRKQVRHTFRRFGDATKYDIAAHVTTLFPELTWKLPPRRRAWETERYNMAIFDAASLGITYFMRFEECQTVFPGLSKNLEEAA